MAADGAGNVFTYSGSWARTALATADHLACPSQSYCVGIHGQTTSTYNGKTWSSPQLIDQDDTLIAISCPVTTFCAAVDTAGRVLTRVGRSWSAPTPLPSDLTYGVTLACYSAAFCAALDSSGDASIWNGTNWAPSVNTGLNGSPTLSCPASGRCIALASGSVSDYRGGAWTAPQFVADGSGYPTALACVNASSCIASFDHLYVLSGTTWTEAGTAPSLSALSCVRSGCEGVGNDYAVNIAGTSSSATVEVTSGVDPTDGAEIDQISCASATFCAAVDETGNALTYDGKAWSTAVPLPGDGGQPVRTVSCVKSVCFAGSIEGLVWEYTTGGWTAVSGLPDFAGAQSLSCATPTSCVAIDNTYDAFSFDGTSWTAGRNIDPGTNGLDSVSCASADWCEAVDGSGNALTDTDNVWSAPKHIDSNEYLIAITCTAVARCLAVDDVGDAFKLTPQGWSKRFTIDPSGGYLAAVSCLSTTSCVALDGYAGYVQLDTRVAGPVEALPNNDTYTKALSCWATGCMAADYSGEVMVGSMGSAG